MYDFRTSLVVGLACLLAACGSDEKPDDELPIGGVSAAGTAASGTGGMGVAGTTTPIGGTGAAGTPAAGTGAGGTSAAGTGAAGTTAGTGAAGTTAGTGAAGTTAGTGVMGTGAFTVDVQLASEVDSSAPGTVGIVTWSIDQNITEASIEFGLDTSYGMTAPVDLTEADYRTLLLGMKPSSTYHFRIVAGDGTTVYTSDDQTVDTGPPPSGVSISSFNAVNEAGRERGFIVTSYWRGGGSTYPFIIDADGDIVWWYDSNVGGGIARARMSADGKNMWLSTASLMGLPLERVSMDTLDSETYPQAVSSHDLTPVSGELIAYLEYGESDCDSIFEIDPAGNNNEIWDSQSVSGGGGGLLGCHSNALRYSKTEDVYTFSDVRTDIYIVSRAGAVSWSLSEIVAGGVSGWGGVQHGHHLLNDSIVVFANSGGSGSASALIEYSLDGAEVMRYDSGDASMNLGDVQRLPGGNSLVTFSNDGLIHEIDAQGNLVLEISGGTSSFGYALWRDSLYGEPPDIGM